MRLPLLALLLGLLAAASSQQPEPGGSESGVTWLVQLSDLHISAHSYPERCASPACSRALAPPLTRAAARSELDLSRFATRLLRRLRPAALLLSGDLTDSKTESRVGSLQYEEEWAGVRRAAEALRAAASLPPTHLLAVRGNHDTFGVAERGGAHDHFGAWRSEEGAAEARAHRLLLGLGTADSPHVTLLQLDASLSPGWRRPCNFAGSWSEAEAEAELGPLGAPAGGVQLAFGHFPLAFIEGRRVERRSGASASALGSQLAARGVTAYLCGHLHWRFGDRLHHWHSFESHMFESNARLPLLELEAGDWKQSRAWRLLALDASAAGGGAPALSFRDFAFESHKAGPLVVLITSPPDARYHHPTPQPSAALGAPATEQPFVRALVFPPKGISPAQLTVTAVARCGDKEMGRAKLSRAAVGNGSEPTLSETVWVGPRVKGARSGSPLPLESFARRCQEPLTLEVQATCESSGLCLGAAATDSRPVAFGGVAPAPMNTTKLATALLTVNGPRFARSLFWALYALFVLLSIELPMLLRMAGARRRSGLLGALLSPFLALAARPRLLAAHCGYSAWLALAPWAVVRPFLEGAEGERAFGLIFATGSAVVGRSSGGGFGVLHAYRRNMDATFVTGPQLVVTCGWVALVLTCLAAADAAASKGAAAKGGAAASAPGSLAGGLRALWRSVRSNPLSASLLAFPFATVVWLSLSWAAELGESYGVLALALSPGVAWVAPLGCAALAAGLASVPAPKLSKD